MFDYSDMPRYFLCAQNSYCLFSSKNENTEKADERLPVDLYPTIMLRTNNKMVDTITGYPGKESVENTLKSY